MRGRRTSWTWPRWADALSHQGTHYPYLATSRREEGRTMIALEIAAALAALGWVDLKFTKEGWGPAAWFLAVVVLVWFPR